jgi:hypothetical protein
VAAVASIDEMVDLTNIGTLFAFVLVCAGITILRRREPDRVRPFRVPFGDWLLPGLGVLSCLFLMYFLPPASWWRFIGWLVLGLSIYTAYGYTRSTIGQAQGRPSRTPLALKLASVGFLATAVGLFVIPHDAGPVTLLKQAAGAAVPEHSRALFGLTLIGIGLIFGIAGSVVGAKRSPAGMGGAAR